jgi:hypothetical protein
MRTNCTKIAKGENQMTHVRIEEQQDFGTPLGLIWFKYVKVTFDGTGQLNKRDTIPVPPGTLWAYIAVTDVDMCFGSVQQNHYSEFGDLRFTAWVNSLEDAKLTYTLQAQLIGQSPTDHWNGTIWLTILCFGKCPVPKPECVAK